jgi:PleD family two-component response regulator
LHFDFVSPKLTVMTQPLAILLYEKLLPGSRLIDRLQELGYRVVTLNDAVDLAPRAAQEKPMVVIADADVKPDRVCAAIAQMKENIVTTHIPVIAIVAAHNNAVQHSVRNAGANLVVHDTAVEAHLKHFLDQALQLD